MTGALGQAVLVGVPLVPLLVALALLVAPPTSTRVAARVAVAASGVSALLAVALVASRPWAGGRDAVAVDEPWVPALDLRLHVGVDGVSLPLVLLTALLGVVVCAHATRRTPAGGSPGLYVACLLAVVGGAQATFLARDALLFFVAFEVVLVPMWALVRYWGDASDPAARRDAAARFVLFTAIGSATMLAGLLLLVLRAGTGDLSRLAESGPLLDRPTQTAVAALLLLGLAVKVPVFPLHTWLPPAHTVAPTAGSVLLAGVLLKLGSYGMVRLAVPTVPEGVDRLAPVLGALGVAGILWGGLACLVERDLKRLVAFSSVAHMGFVVLGIATGSPQGLQGALFANVAHGAITGLLFLVVGEVKHRRGTADLGALGGGMRDSAPRLGGLLAFGAVASLGLPGLAGFWGELLAVYAAWSGGGARSGLAGWRVLAVLAALGTALAAAYLLRVLRLVWHGAGGAGGSSGDGDAGRWFVALAAPLVAVTVVVGLAPGPLLGTTRAAVQALLDLTRGIV